MNLAEALERGRLDFARPEVRELRDLLVLAYRSIDAIEGIAESTGFDMGEFPLKRNIRLTWQALMRAMADQGLLGTLAIRAQEDPAKAAYRSRLQELLGNGPTTKTPSRTADVENVAWRGGPETTRVHLQRILEKRSQLIPIEVAQRVSDLSRSVCRLVVEFEHALAHASGLLIDPGYVLTNHHNVVCREFGRLKSIDLEFDHVQRPPAKRLKVSGDTSGIRKCQEHDWAAIPLAHRIDRTPIPIGPSSSIQQRDGVVIVQHPVGAAKAFSLDALAIRFVDDDRIQYVADTQKGSSGSPVFNLEMEFIALHHAETSTTTTIDGTEHIVYRNQGVHYERILEGLRSENIPFREKRAIDRQGSP